MICLDQKHSPQQVVSEMSGEYYDCQLLLPCSAICTLRWVEDLTGEGNRPLFPVLDLAEYSANSKVGCVCVQDKRILSPWACQHWSGDHDFLQVRKGLRLLVSPLPSCLRTHQFVQRCGDLGQVLNESPLVIHKPQELLNLLSSCWLRPFNECPDMVMRYVHPRTIHSPTEKRGLMLEEHALPRLQHQSILPEPGQHDSQVGQIFRGRSCRWRSHHLSKRSHSPI